MKLLTHLELKHNNLYNLTELREMKYLKYLYLDGNTPLISLNVGMTTLSQLKVMSIEGCSNILHPPQHVCQKGLEAIKIYYSDIEGGVHTASEAKVAGRKRVVAK